MINWSLLWLDVGGATNVRLVPRCCQIHKWYVVTEVTKDFTLHHALVLSLRWVSGAGVFSNLILHETADIVKFLNSSETSFSDACQVLTVQPVMFGIYQRYWFAWNIRFFMWLPPNILHDGHLKVTQPSYKCNIFALNVIEFSFLLLFPLEFESMKKSANT